MDYLNEKSMLKNRGNGIYMSDNEITILEKYNISYENCTSLEELIFKIENYLNCSSEVLEDLESISQRLSEFQYYNYTNK